MKNGVDNESIVYAIFFVYNVMYEIIRLELTEPKARDTSCSVGEKLGKRKFWRKVGGVNMGLFNKKKDDFIKSK